MRRLTVHAHQSHKIQLVRDTWGSRDARSTRIDQKENSGSFEKKHVNIALTLAPCARTGEEKGIAGRFYVIGQL